MAQISLDHNKSWLHEALPLLRQLHAVGNVFSTRGQQLRVRVVLCAVCLFVSNAYKLNTAVLGRLDNVENETNTHAVFATAVMARDSVARHGGRSRVLRAAAADENWVAGTWLCV